MRKAKPTKDTLTGVRADTVIFDDPGPIDRKALTVFVSGHPATQGSKRYVGRGIMVEANKRLPAWRSDIRNALQNGNGEPRVSFGKAEVSVKLFFLLPRPKSASPNKYLPATKKSSDLDKLTRAIFDAVTSAGVWYDDCQVTHAEMEKAIALKDQTPGCFITIIERP
jgi:crossover junction endodeoxyribonuclease RusA